MFYKRVVHPSEWATFPLQLNFRTKLQLSQQKKMPTNKDQIRLALQAIERDKELSTRRAAALHSVSRTTLIRRRMGVRSRTDIIANSPEFRYL